MHIVALHINLLYVRIGLVFLFDEMHVAGENKGLRGSSTFSKIYRVDYIFTVSKVISVEI